MAGNRNLNSAARAKKDKFYTQMEDIENELHHYKDFFKDKVVLCNCDDPIESQFFVYSTQLEGDEKYCAGDFRSKECIELLKQADVIVTNPPFSVFREFVKLLVDYDKKFLIVGNMNAITYKEIFPLIKEDKIWLGYGFKGGDPRFTVPDDYESDTRFWIDENGQRWRSFGNLHWYTNIETPKRYWELLLYKKYSPELYPRYDNYDAIEVSKTAEIPEDYYGVMGVPITFLDKYDPRQFEILGATESEGVGFSNGLWHDDSQFKQATINGKKVYKRIFVKRR